MIVSAVTDHQQNEPVARLVLPLSESGPVRCLLELDSDCRIAVTLIDGCTAADVHELCRLLALAGPHLDHLDVHQLASDIGPHAAVDDRDIMADLRRACGQVPLFTMEFTTGGLSVDAETAFAHRLIDVAEGILLHAEARRRAS